MGELALKDNKMKVNIWQRKLKKTDQWAKYNGPDIIEYYVDAGLSGRNKKRKGYQYLLVDEGEPASKYRA